MEAIGYVEPNDLVNYKNQVVDISKQLANYIKHIKRRCNL